MSYKDALKKSQGTSERLRLDTVSVIKAKGVLVPVPNHPSATFKEAAFTTWVKEGTEGKEVAFKTPIKGILVGRAFMLSHYDKDIKGSFRAGHYFSNKTVMPLWGPKAGGGAMEVFRGDIDGIMAWLAKNSSGTPKKHMCLFVLTTKGLIEIQTNMSIGIDTMKAYKNLLLDKWFTFTPTMYAETNEDISASTKKILGPVAASNPPAYAKMEPSSDITEEEAEQLKLVEYSEKFTAWALQQGNGVASAANNAENTQAERSVAPPATVGGIIPESHPKVNPQKQTTPEVVIPHVDLPGEDPSIVVVDDLPF